MKKRLITFLVIVAIIATMAVPASAAMFPGPPATCPSCGENSYYSLCWAEFYPIVTHTEHVSPINGKLCYKDGLKCWTDHSCSNWDDCGIYVEHHCYHGEYVNHTECPTDYYCNAV